MPAADFAAAQQRLAARRAQRARRHHEASLPSALSLPYPFSSLNTAWDAIRGREGTRPFFRVGQVDAELLDEELLTLLKGQVTEGLKHFGTHITDTYAAEILLALRAILFKLSIWNNNASYGAHLQGLRYADARSTLSSRPPPKPWQKAAYGLVTIGGRYAWTKWEDYLLAANDDYAASPSPSFKLLSRITEYANSAHDFASLASFLVFLVNGRYRTLADRLLRLRLTPTSHATSREVSFEYLNRQLVWHAFTEFLLFLLPLVGIARWRRILARTWRKLKVSLLQLLGRSSTSTSEDDDGEEKQLGGELGFLPERTCAICYRDQNPTTATEQDIIAQSSGGGGVVGSAATDITNPYETVPCGCLYCFACIAQRIANEEGEGWTCLRCGELIKECRPWGGDVLEERGPSTTSPDTEGQHGGNGHGKSVGFATVGGQGQDRDEKQGLRDVDPMPEPEDILASTTTDAAPETSRGFDLGESLALSESAEWARASEDRSSDDDEEQSNGYDDTEEESENDR
jgi:peroxin-2